ncbi:unnamed protein product [Brassica rapa subsp. narinosa]
MKSPVSDYGGTRCVPGFAKGWKPRVQCGTWFERRAVIFKTPESIFPSADRSSKLAHARMQYDMHASSFQRDITTSQQGAKTNGAPEYCTRDCTDNGQERWVTQDEAYSAVKENMARSNQVKRA